MGREVCGACGEEYEERRITLALPREECGLAVFRNVPADVCPRCGEPRFSLETARQLMASASSGEAPDAVLRVPVYDLALR